LKAMVHPLPRGLKRLGNLANLRRDGDRRLQLCLLNEECLVGAGHQPGPIESLPFVHTARRCYRWHCDRSLWSGCPPWVPAKLVDVTLLEEAKVVTRLL